MKNNTKDTYNFNNWLKEDNKNTALRMIDEKKAALAINKEGALVYRLSKDEPFETSRNSKLISKVFSNLIGEEVVLIDKPKVDKDGIPTSLYVEAQDLKLIVDEKFEPHVNEEFIEKENRIYDLNKYNPSHYMQLEPKPNYSYHNDFPAISNLINHLSNHDLHRYRDIINWHAYLFQGLKKAQTALVLRGDQGAGKGIFFNEVIEPLVGKEYTKTINDKSLNQKYLGGLVEDVLFFNLDEISVQKSQNASVKNFLKALVTNETITAEKKYKTTKKETRIYGQVLITSNEPEVLEIEPSDRRYTVYSTAGNLKYTNYLGYGSYEALSEAIKGELESFMCYLKCYKVEEQAANTAQMTPEKQELIDIYIQKQEQEKMKSQPKLTKQQINIQEFGLAVSNRYHSYFLNMQFDAPNLYNEVLSDLYNGIFKVSNLLAVYKVMYGSGSFKTTAELLRALQEYYFYQFTTNQMRVFSVDDEQVEYLILLNPSSYPMY